MRLSAKHQTLLLLLAALAFGVTMRLVWPLDIEVKNDESETFNYLRDWSRGQIPFPWIGQHSSNGLRHPGLGIWIFLAGGKANGTETIVDLARIPPILSILNLCLLLAFARFALGERARQLWYQTVALMAVNPFLVLLDRKLWHPSVMGLFVSGFFLSWLKRGSRLGSFLLGVFFLLPGQVHMSGFFLTLGFALTQLLWDRWRAFRGMHLGFFLAGLVAGLLPLLPWIVWLAGDLGSGNPLSLNFWRFFSFKFLNFWFSNAYAMLVGFPFGHHLLRNPAYLAPSLLAALFLPFGVVIYFRRLHRFVKRRQRSALTRLEHFSFLGTGFLATFSLMHITNYFSLCLGFAPFLSVVRALNFHRRARALLLALVIGQAGMSLYLLHYVHNFSFVREGSSQKLGKFGLPIRDCGKCEGGPSLEKISGGEVVVPAK